MAMSTKQQATQICWKSKYTRTPHTPRTHTTHTHTHTQVAELKFANDAPHHERGKNLLNYELSLKTNAYVCGCASVCVCDVCKIGSNLRRACVDGAKVMTAPAAGKGLPARTRVQARMWTRDKGTGTQRPTDKHKKGSSAERLRGRGRESERDKTRLRLTVSFR